MSFRVAPLLLLASIAPLTGVLLTGCSLSVDSTAAHPASVAMRGHVHGGQQPVAASTITVWEMGTSGYGTGATQLATVLTDVNGNFQFANGAYTCDFNNAPVYITAQGGDPGSGGNPSLMLAAGIGACGAASGVDVNINEVTTAATALALGHFFTTTQGGAPSADIFGGTAAGSGTYNVGLVAANNNTIPALVNLQTGYANPSSSTQVIESAKLNSIANTIAACVNSSGATSATENITLCGQLFAYTQAPTSNTRPADTLQAAVNMSLYPYQNVANLYNLATAGAPFPGLSAAPNDWTLAIAYTSPTLGLGIASNLYLTTSSNIDIDASGKVWFPTNTAGSHGVAYFDPASATFNGPYSTSLQQPQYVAIDLSNNIWATDLSSSAVTSNSTTSPTAQGLSYAAPGSTGGGPITVGSDNATVFNFNTSSNKSTGLISAGSMSVDASYAFQGIPTGLIVFDTSIHLVLATTESTNNGCAEEVSKSQFQDVEYNSGGFCSSGGVAEMPNGTDYLSAATYLNQLGTDDADLFFTPPVAINAPEGIAVDGAGQVWIANSGNASVSTMSYLAQNYDQTDYHQTSPVAYLHGGSNGGTMTAPYGIAIDRSGNVWISNASCVSNANPCTPSGFTLTELVGAAAPTVTPLSAQLGSNAGTRPNMVRQTPLQPRANHRHHLN